MTSSEHRYDDAACDAVYRVIRERRDVRHFLSTPVDTEVLVRLLCAAHAGPSVGLTQPWRFIRITELSLRQRIHQLVQQERQHTATALNERAAEFMRLKVEGILQCGELLVVAVKNGGTREVFGRRLLPEMDLASVACAIQNLWLAARAEGLGVGWVSMFDPLALAELLGLPSDVRPIAILCIGHVEAFQPVPMLVLEKWRTPRALAELVFENTWSDTVLPP
jgi:5,6-dimethylbenzimidazole synthase